jgi:hypothetical protein
MLIFFVRKTLGFRNRCGASGNAVEIFSIYRRMAAFGADLIFSEFCAAAESIDSISWAEGFAIVLSDWSTKGISA